MKFKNFTGNEKGIPSLLKTVTTSMPWLKLTLGFLSNAPMCLTYFISNCMPETAHDIICRTSFTAPVLKKPSFAATSATSAHAKKTFPFAAVAVHVAVHWSEAFKARHLNAFFIEVELQVDLLLRARQLELPRLLAKTNCRDEKHHSSRCQFRRVEFRISTC